MHPDPQALVPLTTALNDFEAQTIAEALRAQGIPAEVFAAAASMMQTVAVPVQVLVQEKDLAGAKNALRAIKADSVDIDWSEIDTGDRAPVSCPHCASERAKGPAGAPCPSCGRTLPAIERTPSSSSPLTPNEWRWIVITGATVLVLLAAFVIAAAWRR